MFSNRVGNNNLSRITSGFLKEWSIVIVIPNRLKKYGSSAVGTMTSLLSKHTSKCRGSSSNILGKSEDNFPHRQLYYNIDSNGKITVSSKMM